jgi:hypothetical protein
MATPPDPFGEDRIKQLRLYLYLLPVIGFFPALWRLYRKQGDRQEQQVSRLAVTLMLGWLITYLGLGWGADQLNGAIAFRVMFFNGLWTSGYFLSCLFLMVQVWQKSSKPSLPVVDRLANDLDRKFFS